MDASPCNIKAPCLATLAMPLLSLLLLSPFPGHRLFPQGDTSKRARRRGRPGCQHEASPLPHYLFPHNSSASNRRLLTPWAGSAPRSTPLTTREPLSKPAS
ncbi:uncharacterized [Tachysurus ichikawai]